MLVLAPWGMPYGWRVVTYEINGVRCKSCTSLLPLLVWLRSEEFKDSKINVYMVILDSIIDWRKQSSVTSNPCQTCFDEFSNIIAKASNSLTYAELRQYVTEFAKEFIKCVTSKTECSIRGETKVCSEVLEDVLNGLHVVTAPAIGRSGGVWVFKGRIRDYEVTVLKELSDSLVETPYSIVVVDLSHGINFMPSIMVRVVPRIASILLLAHK